ncbi:hypothetical protein KQX54_004938 [Cotesia glomerata]|uniref:Uncharacterized protein n=1 Tax=Cotesia glomerata TaxID=32391 RepID=A0AAV7I9K6_COTGL|nr:hypothetical protein KQX54_004938 [Cotesia glomerata]
MIINNSIIVLTEMDTDMEDPSWISDGSCVQCSGDGVVFVCHWILHGSSVCPFLMYSAPCTPYYASGNAPVHRGRGRGCWICSLVLGWRESSDGIISLSTPLASAPSHPLFTGPFLPPTSGHSIENRE